MSDSAAVLDTDLNSGAIESAIQGWLDDNGGSVTSVDSTRVVPIGPNRGVVIVMYTA